ncbi:N-terminal methionine N(alpha)-acetyltransferase NatE [Malassezia equina]|uniref:N-terminal methionine N(Alpha)-acetyltransferase NatE n=1 Tax=Malassezia equina TaxID=1381935 RepID=A0AAF0EF20_9BASI|nr:N-terminal methionine N(alpha)-acetyltransferase NatE [Malassezia equina]
MTYPPPPTSYEARVKADTNAPVRRAITARSVVAIADITRNNINQVRKLNEVLLPVPYSPAVYEQVLEEDTNPICKLGLFNDIPVGNVCCRLEEGKDATMWKVYIMTLGVLPTYRCLGVASALLEYVLDVAGPSKNFAGRKIESVYLHVQISNPVARMLYEKFGFELVDTLESYYPSITPSSAWVLSKHT